MKKLFKNLTGKLLGAGLAIGLCGLALPARAGLQSQTDTNNLVIASTNTFLLYGDMTGSFTNGEAPGGASFIDLTKCDDAWVQVGGFFTNNTAGASNVTYRIAATIDLANWTNNFQSVTLAVPANTTNWVSANVLIQNAPPIVGLRAVENPNTGNITAKSGSVYLKAYSKNGI